MGLRLGTLLGCACLLFFGFLLSGCTSAEEPESGVQKAAEEAEIEVQKAAQEVEIEVQKAAEEVESEVQEVVEDPIDTIEVNETEFSLDPADITLEQPGTYVFKAVNVGNAVHSLEIEGQGIEEETPIVQPAKSGELKVNLDPGTYKLYCPVGNHEERGMVGTVTVRAG